MRLLILLISLILTSCSGKDVNIKVTKKPKRQYVEQLCPTCNGTGKVKMSTGQKAGFALLTFGVGLLVDECECETCRGSGIIKVPVPRKEIIEE